VFEELKNSGSVPPCTLQIVPLSANPLTATTATSTLQNFFSVDVDTTAVITSLQLLPLLLFAMKRVFFIQASRTSIAKSLETPTFY
jgi:hypothetical protein